MRVWLSVDGGMYAGIGAVWVKKPKKNEMGDFMEEENGNGFATSLRKVVGLKNGECAELEIRRVKKVEKKK